jgi:hypothetical protein
MRPRGDPERLAAGSQALTAAAAELERIDGELDAGRGLAGPDAWHGAAASAYRARSGSLEGGAGEAVRALREAAAGLAELSVGLAGAQSLWDHAASLAASAGLPPALDAPGGLPSTTFPALDPRTAISARVAELVAEATERAALAGHAAARRLGEAAATAAQAGAPAGGVVAGRAGAPAGGVGAPGRGGGSGRPATGDGRGGPAQPYEEDRSLLARGLWVVDRIGIAVGAGLAALEARARALTRLVQSGEEPAAGLAAVRALASFERSAFSDSLLAFLPLGGPAITLAANLIGGEHGEPLLRALVRSLGESIGADAGQRLGMAVCGVEAGATEGAGAIVCPAIAIAATSAGASLGGAAAVKVYDTLGPDPGPPPAAATPVRAGPAPDPLGAAASGGPR